VKGGVDAQALAEYAQSLRRPGYLRASYEYFRTFPRDVQDTIRNRGTALTMPVLAIGADGALGELVPEQAQKYADDVTGAVVASGHWLPEEAPEILLEHLLPFLGK
jgi:pimeloyl-ACP methyl ester carboxylesterase